MSRFIIEKKKPKGKMYECIAFFEVGTPKKWKYVTNLKTFVDFLTKQHSTWKYVNVYEKGTKVYLKRFYPGNAVPKVLSLLLFAAVGLSLLTLTIRTFNNNLHDLRSHYPLKNTFSKKLTFLGAANQGQTFTTDFNYSSTIPTHGKAKGGASC